MSTVWRDVDAELRRSRVQVQFAGAANGVRDWLSNLHAGRPLLTVIDVIPVAPDVRTLLDPLQDSALTRLTEASRAAGDAEEPVAAPHASRAGQTPRAARRFSAAMRFAASDGRAMASPAAQPAARVPADSANMPARVAALIARYERARGLVAEDAVRRAPWTDARTERRIVPFWGHRAGVGEPVPRPQAAASPAPLTPMLARWSEVAAIEPAQRLEAATGRALAGYELAQLDASLASSLPAASLSVRGAPASLECSAIEAEPVPPPAVLRIGDLAAPPLPRDTRRADVATPAQASSDVMNALVPPATGGGVLGRMAGALARIEERLAASTPSADPPTQWLAEDDNLAERIHDILRRQALRHGIDAP